jgi:hypothetical protein
LLGEGPENRKDWMENRLQELAEVFAVSVGGLSMMDNHLHVLVRLDPDSATGWSDEEVVRRWGRLFPLREHWLCPVQDRRQLDSIREGMLEGTSLGSYLRLIDYTGRMFREGKAAISAELAGILERLGSNADTRCVCLSSLSSSCPAWRPPARSEE